MRPKNYEQVFLVVFGSGMWAWMGLESGFFVTAISQLWGLIVISAVLLIGGLAAGDIPDLFSLHSQRGKIALACMAISVLSALLIFLSTRIGHTFWWAGFIVFTASIAVLYFWSINKRPV